MLKIHLLDSSIKSNFPSHIKVTLFEIDVPALLKAQDEVVNIAILLFHCLNYAPQIRPGKTCSEKAQKTNPSIFFGGAELTSMRCEWCPPLGPLPLSHGKGDDGFKAQPCLKYLWHLLYLLYLQYVSFLCLVSLVSQVSSVSLSSLVSFESLVSLVYKVS